MAIERQLLSERARLDRTADLFGVHFPLQFEPFVYQVTSALSSDYAGGYWEFNPRCHGGFYMAPSTTQVFRVLCDNGYEGTLSADALGITVCLYAYSHLSFSRNEHMGELYTRHYYLLREYLLEHPEAGDILRATD